MDDAKKALVFEPCPYHYVTLGSYAYFLHALGYEVTLLVHASCNPELELGSTFSFLADVRYFSDDLWRDASKTVYSDIFDLVWISTINTPQRLDGQNLFETLGGYPKPRDGLFGVLHDASAVERLHLDLTRFAKVFTLADNSKRLAGTAPISPAFFGQPSLGTELSHPLSILSIGVSASIYGAMTCIVKDKDNKDYSIVSANRKSKWRFWLDAYYRKYFVREEKAEGITPERLPNIPIGLMRAAKKLNNLVDADSATLRSCVRSSDFLLANFEGEASRRFSNNQVSGTSLFSLGFNVPLLVNATVAESWGFDGSNAVVFPDGRFDLALKRIKAMTPGEYREIQESLLWEQERRLSVSLENIELAISEWRARHPD